VSIRQFDLIRTKLMRAHNILIYWVHYSFLTIPMNTDIKANIAILISIAALVVSILNRPAPQYEFIKQAAVDAGLSSKTYDQCIADPAARAEVNQDIAESMIIAEALGQPSLGTPFNLVVTDTQLIPVAGAYPEEFFQLMVLQHRESGEIPQATLDQFEITPLDESLREQIRLFNPEIDAYKGSANPSFTVIEYSDFQCPFCARVHPTLQSLVDTNDDVAWVYRHLPLDFHPEAMPAAIAAECAYAEEGNDAFWMFTDTIFENQDQL